MGAAWYKTKQGVLEVWSLPKQRPSQACKLWFNHSRTAALFTPSKERPISSLRWPAQSLLKHGNLTFEVRCDEELAENITQVLQMR